MGGALTNARRSVDIDLEADLTRTRKAAIRVYTQVTYFTRVQHTARTFVNIGARDLKPNQSEIRFHIITTV